MEDDERLIDWFEYTWQHWGQLVFLKKAFRGWLVISHD